MNTPDKTTSSWTTRGFEDFRKGNFGNGGQNLYVSKAGTLQRIHQFDLTGNGFIDLVFCNSQSHFEKPDAQVFSDLLNNSRYHGLRCHGCRGATVADLNGDGYDDLVLGCFKDGIARQLNAMVFYGSPDGLTENYHIELPAPYCTAVAAGDFNGDGKVDLAFITSGKLRIFYQTGIGFEIKRFQDYDLECSQLEAFDLDGDGFADLVIRFADGSVTVFWGGPGGFQMDRKTAIIFPGMNRSEAELEESSEDVSDEEFVADADPLVRVINLNGSEMIFCPLANEAFLVPVNPDRSFSHPLRFDISDAYAVAKGDINGDGFDDLVFAARDKRSGEECSWIYWGSSGRDYSGINRVKLFTERVADVAVGDLSGNGCDDILIVQNRSLDSFTTESLVFRGCPEGFKPEPLRLDSHDARRGFMARTSDEELPQVILTSNFGRSASDDLKNTIYFGSERGYSPDDRKDILGWGSYNALYADLNDDGLADLVIANGSEFSAAKDPGSYVYFNGPKGIAGIPDLILPTCSATVAACGDLNRNGYLDLVFCGYRRPEIIIFPGGPEGFKAEKKIVIPTEYEGVPYGFLFSLCLVDINRDGWLDLVIGGGTEERALILWGGPDGFSMDRCQALAAYIPRFITAADLNGNGYPDILVGARIPQMTGPHDAYLNIYWNGPDGIREDRKTMLPVKSTNGVTVGDFNNDGMLDIFVGSYSDGRERDLESYIYWNRPGTGFTLLDRLCLQTHAVGGCLAADLNEDGWTDLVVTNHKVLGDHMGYSEVWWNGPEGLNVSRTTALPTVGGRGPSVVHPGNILDRGPEEYYESPAFHLPEGAVVVGLTWEGDIPAKTWVKGQVRVAGEEGIHSTRRWMGPDRLETSFWSKTGDERGTEIPGRWVQYRLSLGATNSCTSPRIKVVSVFFELRQESPQASGIA